MTIAICIVIYAAVAFVGIAILHAAPKDYSGQ